MVTIISNNKSFHSVEKTKDTLQYAYHLKDYQLNKNVLEE